MPPPQLIFSFANAILLATIFKADPLDPARGKRYRDKILKAGGSREETETLEVSYLVYVDIISMIYLFYFVGLPWPPTKQRGFLERIVRDNPDRKNLR